MKPQKEDDLPLEETSSTTKLLRIFSNEIARDGGAALVTSLKDYAANAIGSTRSLTPKRVNALLVDSIQKPKVLAFLEAHPVIFQVDREATPHWVILMSDLYVDWTSLTPNPTQNMSSSTHEIQAKLCDRILYALHHRCAKTARRRRRQLDRSSQEKEGTANETCIKFNEEVNISWLLTQCGWEFHEYLRVTGTYLKRIYNNNTRLAYSDTVRGPDHDEEKSFSHGNQDNYCFPERQVVHPVGSRAWEDLVLKEFASLLLKTTKNGLENLVVDTERKKITYTVEPSSNTTVKNAHDFSYLRVLENTLMESLDKDGATQVRLEILLHRYKELRRHLGGRDLWDIVQQYRNCTCNNSNIDTSDGGLFHNLDIYKEGPDIILQTKSKKRQGRMQVDYEGNFSVTNGKWGMAMAKTLARCCEQIGWTLKSKLVDSAECNESNSEMVAAIDLTASVGGMTLGLAKTRFFRPVIAIEIDPHRAELCRQNMTELMSGECDADVVYVRTMDAMDAIPTLPSRSCLVIDPPWGGENYKKKNFNLTEQRDELRMGPWTLEDILCKIYECLRPCLVGLRLPVTYIVDNLVKRLKLRIRQSHNEEIDPSAPVFIKSLVVRKLSVQLFVVLYFSQEETGVSMDRVYTTPTVASPVPFRNHAVL